MQLKLVAFISMLSMSVSASAQAVYTFEGLQAGTALAGQDGWVVGITGSGSPTVEADIQSLVARGTFVSAARATDAAFPFAEVFDTQAVRLEFDIHYIDGGGNESIQTYFYDDQNGNGTAQSDEDVFQYGLARAFPHLPNTHLQFVGASPIHSNVSSLFSSDDRLTIRADIVQLDTDMLFAKLYFKNNSSTTPEWVLIACGKTLTATAGKGLADINAVQIRFDSGLSSIDNISISTIEPSICLPDTNYDCVLSPADFTAWIAAYQSGSAECDQNGDKVCTPADFTAWISNFDTGC